MPGTRLNEYQLVEIMAKHRGLTRKQEASVLERSNSAAAQQFGRRWPGDVIIPGIRRLVVVEKPATARHEGISPFTRAPMTYSARPARRVIRAMPLKALKDAI